MREDGFRTRRRPKRLMLAAAFALSVYGLAQFFSEPEPEPMPSEGPPRGETLEAWGAYLFSLHGCVGCHSIAGVRGVGGSVDGIFGQSRHFTDGTEGTVDEAYLRESIVAPHRRVVVGFSGAMPRYDLTTREVDALVAYLFLLSP